MLEEKQEKFFIKVHLPLFLVQICFASLPIYSKIAFKTFGPGILAFLRISTVALIFASVFFFFQREKIKEKKHLLYFAALAFFGATGNIFFYLKGLELSTAINATIIVSSVPVFTILVAVIMRQEKFSYGKLIGIVVAVLGVSNLINFSQFQMGGYLTGNLLVVLNSFLYSIYLVMIKPMLKIYRPFTILTYVFIFASIEIIPLTIGDFLRFDFASADAASLFPLFMVLTFGTLFPYLLNSLALKHAPSSLVAIYVYLQPVLAALLAVIMLGEVITFTMIISAVLIIIGVTIVRFPNLIFLSRKRLE